jgi:diguanylate cyclase (GGDEF)-like protein
MNVNTTAMTSWSNPKRFGGVLLLAWTLVIAASLAWNLVQQRQETLALAHTAAVVLIEEDLLYNRWACGHGGVYVPITDATQPNPYLAHLPERDILTPSGRRLTLIIAPNVNRQVYSLAKQTGKPQGHVTSLKPLQPENIPDAWEAAALKSFAQGRKEVSGTDTLGGKTVMRLMRPFITEPGCLNCHVNQEYHVGEVRGGISVMLPMVEWWGERATMVALGHGCLWLLGVFTIVMGVRNLDRANAQIITVMHTDPLTGLANRRFFIEMLEKATAFARRHAQPLSFIMFDLDNFKAVNDTYGHAAGDQVLTSLAQLMNNFIRKEDLAAWFGGEEFILMLPSTDLEQAAIMGERLRAQLENLSFFTPPFCVTASFGITQYRPDDTFETLIKRVDNALYAAKGAGKNKIMPV